MTPETETKFGFAFETVFQWLLGVADSFKQNTIIIGLNNLGLFLMQRPLFVGKREDEAFFSSRRWDAIVGSEM